MAQKIRTDQREIVAFKAGKTTTVTIPVSTFTQIIYNDESFDTTNSYDTTTGIFTVPYDGYYSLNARISIDALSADARAILTLYKNGSEYERLYMIVAGSLSADATLAGSTLGQLSAGDSISVYAWHSSASSKGIEVVSHYSEFSAHLIART